MSPRPRRALIYSAISLGTGSGLRARYLCSALGRMGWDAELVSPGLPPLPYSAELALSAPYFALRALQRADLVVAIKPYPNAWLAALIAKARGACTVLDIDDLDSAYRQGFSARLGRAIQAPAFRLPLLFSTHHPGLERHLLRDHNIEPARVLNLAQGVDLEIFDPAKVGAAARGAWRKRLGLGKRKALLFAAHLNVACQLDLTLRWLGPWLRQRKDAVLLVAGGGPDLTRFRALAAPLGGQVVFLGQQEPEQIAVAMASADLGLSAYGPGEGNQHRVPMKVAEYLAMGLPVVSNLVPGLRPLAPYIHVARDDGRDYPRQAEQALRSSVRTRLGQRWVRQRLGWDSIARGFVARLSALGALKDDL